MRDVLRGNLAGSLRAVSDEDRLAFSWTVICGRALAERGTVTGYSGGVAQVEVVDAVWMVQMTSMRGALTTRLAEFSGLPVKTIEFTVRRRSAE